jgi:membrane protein YdbS with pleckstrin-like domain
MIAHAIALAPDETITHIVRRHWYHLVLVGWIDVVVLILFAIGVGMFDYRISGFIAGDPVPIVFVSTYLISLVGLLLWMHFFAVWTDHWLDAWVITNKRIIDIEQKGFFSRQVSSFPLERIQDVTYETNGVIATALHFGNVRIQTASISSDFIMRQVPHPDQVKEKIMDAVAQKETPALGTVR